MKKLFPLLLLLAAQVSASVYVVETHNPLSDEQIKNINSIKGAGEIKRFLPFGSGYLERLYEIEISNDKALQKISSNELVKLVEGDHEVDFFEIKPNKQSEMSSKDMLYPFQWGVQNQKQIVSAQMPNGGPEETEGVEGQDIDWKKAIQEIESRLKKTPTVAVVDMGLDYSHPELKDQIYKNEVECDNGNLQPGTREDRDKNGLPGDCMGWNFAATDRLFDALPTDDKGHGTHVSGIIAAKRDNDIGIAGVSDKIKILPIRVTGRVDETSEKERLIIRAASRRIAKGIFYAVHRKVDVINLSLGWPKAMNTNYLYRAIMSAIQNDVIIVAAAGNNNSPANIFPCAYREVVCVGSVDVDGKVSAFSNHGAEVDILAPGDQIVSTIPTEFIPLKLNLQGYDIMSGTSQAAPYVSAAAALIKASNPEINSTEVQRRLFDSALERKDQEKSMHGLLQLDKAFRFAQAPSIKPVFKQMSEAVYNPIDNQLMPIGLFIKNFGQETQEIKVDIESLSFGLDLKQHVHRIEKLERGEIVQLKIEGKLFNPKIMESQVKLKVTVSAEGMQTRSFTHSMSLAKNLYLEPKKSVARVEFSDPERKHPLISFRFQYDETMENRINQADRMTRVNLRTVEEVYPKGDPNYYLVYTDPKDQKEKEIFFFELDGPSLKEKHKSIKLSDTVDVLSVTKLDYNYDGAEDYLVKSIKVKDRSTIDIQYRYLTKELEPLFPEMEVIHYYSNRDTVAVTPKTVRYVKTKLSNGQFLATPVFVTDGKLNDLDQIPDPFMPADRSIKRRVYRLELVEGEDTQYRYRSFMNKGFSERVRQEFAELVPPAVSAEDTGVETVGMAFQTEKDFNEGISKAMLSFGLGYERFTIEAEIKGKEVSMRHLDFSGSRLIGNALHPVYDLTRGLEKDANAFVGFLTNSTVNVSNLSYEKENNYVYRLDTPYDRLMSFIALFEDGDTSYMFFETIDNILMVSDRNGQREESKLSTTKFSFLPGQIMSDIFYPIAVSDQLHLKPGIYIDATSVSGNRVYTMTTREEQLFAPADLSVDLPSICGYEERYCGAQPPQRHFGTLYCLPMNPVKNSNGSFDYTVLCKNKGEYELIRVPVEL